MYRKGRQGDPSGTSTFPGGGAWTVGHARVWLGQPRGAVTPRGSGRGWLGLLTGGGCVLRVERGPRPLPRSRPGGGPRPAHARTGASALASPVRRVGGRRPARPGRRRRRPRRTRQGRAARPGAAQGDWGRLVMNSSDQAAQNAARLKSAGRGAASVSTRAAVMRETRKTVAGLSTHPPSPRRHEIPDPGLVHQPERPDHAARRRSRPANDAPLIAGPLAASRLAASPFPAGLLAAVPLAASPLAAVLLAASLLPAGPLAAGPLAADPLAAGLLAASLLAASLLAAGPFAAGPCADGVGGAGGCAAAVLDSQAAALAECFGQGPQVRHLLLGCGTSGAGRDEPGPNRIRRDRAGLR